MFEAIRVADREGRLAGLKIVRPADSDRWKNGTRALKLQYGEIIIRRHPDDIAFDELTRCQAGADCVHAANVPLPANVIKLIEKHWFKELGDAWRMASAR